MQTGLKIERWGRKSPSTRQRGEVEPSQASEMMHVVVREPDLTHLDLSCILKRQYAAGLLQYLAEEQGRLSIEGADVLSYQWDESLHVLAAFLGLIVDSTYIQQATLDECRHQERDVLINQVDRL